VNTYEIFQVVAGAATVNQYSISKAGELGTHLGAWTSGPWQVERAFLSRAEIDLA
jgi:hypothetical protein